MKTIKVKYKTNSGDWFADINIFYYDCLHVKIMQILSNRYGEYQDYEIGKWYN